jgi:hypothetical protein
MLLAQACLPLCTEPHPVHAADTNAALTLWALACCHKGVELCVRHFLLLGEHQQRLAGVFLPLWISHFVPTAHLATCREV